MNVGQIMEPHLGWASRELGEKVRQLVESEFSPRAVRDWLRKIYDSKRFDDHLESLDDEEVRKVAALLSKGVFLASHPNAVTA